MTNDLISREWLKDAFDNLCCHNCKTCRNFRNEDSFYKCGLLENAPTVDITKFYYNGFTDGKELSKRPQGEWKIIEHETQYLMGIYQCNLCSYKYACPDEFVRNFCPNCGASMQKGGAEE